MYRQNSAVCRREAPPPPRAACCAFRPGRTRRRREGERSLDPVPSPRRVHFEFSVATGRCSTSSWRGVAAGGTDRDIYGYSTMLTSTYASRDRARPPSCGASQAVPLLPRCYRAATALLPLLSLQRVIARFCHEQRHRHEPS